MATCGKSPGIRRSCPRTDGRNHYPAGARKCRPPEISRSGRVGADADRSSYNHNNGERCGEEDRGDGIHFPGRCDRRSRRNGELRSWQLDGTVQPGSRRRQVQARRTLHPTRHGSPSAGRRRPGARLRDGAPHAQHPRSHPGPRFGWDRHPCHRLPIRWRERGRTAPICFGPPPAAGPRQCVDLVGGEPPRRRRTAGPVGYLVQWRPSPADGRLRSPGEGGGGPGAGDRPFSTRCEAQTPPIARCSIA
jgi:hypothetical protein